MMPSSGASMAIDLEHLMIQAKAGDSAAFAELYDSLRYPLSRALNRVLPSSDVEDALQETMLRVWQSLDTFDIGKGDVLSWASRIACNFASDILRRQNRQRRGGLMRLKAMDLGQMPDEPDAESSDDIREVIEEEINALPSQFSRDVARSVMDGKSVCSVANRNGVSFSTASRRYRLIMRLFKTSHRLKDIAGMS